MEEASKAFDVESPDYEDHLAEFLATNPYRCTTFGRTVDLVNNPEKIPDFSRWMARVVKDSITWGREHGSSPTSS